MKYYINGKRVSYNTIKLEHWKRKYWYKLVQIFIEKLFYKYRTQITMGLIIVFLLVVIFGIAINKTNADIEIKPSGALCQNLAFTNTDRFKKECNIESVEKIIKSVKSGKYSMNKLEKNITKQTIKWNNRLYSVQVWRDRVETMKKLGYSDTRILDLLTILNMECDRYDGKCFNGNDIGPFQINKVHKNAYNMSWRLYHNPSGLFKYQLNYANKLLDSYDKRFCGENVFWKIGRKYTTKRHWNCIAYSYNGHPRYKYAYAKLGWERRKIISNILFK